MRRWFIAGLISLSPAVALAQDKPLFSEMTGAVGFPEKPPTDPDGGFNTPEITSGGVALFDYNNGEGTIPGRPGRIAW